MATGVSRRGPHVLPDREPDVRPSDRGGGLHQRREQRRATWHRNYCVYCVGLSMVIAWVIVLAVYQQGSINVDVRRTAAKMLLHGELRSTERRVNCMLPLSSLSVEARFQDGKLEIERSKRGNFVGLRLPRLALVIGSEDTDSQLLMLLTLTKGISDLGYRFTVFTFEDGGAYYLWKHIGCQVHNLRSQELLSIDWSNYEGIILGSLEGQRVLSSLMQEPFLSIPLIWLIHEDTLGTRFLEYEEKGFDGLISQWRSSFYRANAIIFPDFSLPLVYASLGATNFMVISAPLADVLKAENYLASNSRHQMRKDYGYGDNELIVLFVGSYFHYDDIIWDFAAAMQSLAQQVSELEKTMNGGVHFIFLCGNSSDAYSSSFQELATQMGFSTGSIRRYPFDHDVNSLLLVADIVLHGSFNEEPSFPPLLLRAMSFGVPVITPNISQITKHVIDGVNGFLFQSKDLATLTKAFSRVIGEGKLSDLAKKVASEGKILAKNMLAYEFVSSYAKLLENVLYFPSNVMLPASFSQIQQKTWSWDLFERKTTNENDQSTELSVLEMLELQFEKNLTGKSKNETLIGDFPTQLDWEDLNEIEIAEDVEAREMQEVEERTETPLRTWEEVDHTARKAEKAKSEKHERDEGELERTGQAVCIYEIYIGEGAWLFLHHSSIYRGISLSRSGIRPGTDDVDAVSRLPVLEDSHYRDLLCEFGAILSIANKVDTMHKLPWIGFQSWPATSRMASLSRTAEQKLETIMMEGNRGDAVYYWALLDTDLNVNKRSSLGFWSLCDSLNAGHCRSSFSDAFRQMYGLGDDVASLPPMPDGGSWSALHSWIMPTPSFLEFIMFSRMFLDSLDQLSYNNSDPSCLLGSSEIEKRQCYCRILEFLVNIWAYHSGRRMFYLNPVMAQLSEQQPLEQRQGVIWSKYFQPALLKSMDEDLAEKADDRFYASPRWLWPLMGEVHWQGVFDREREQRYVKKMDKKRKAKEKLIDRQKYGYKQKALA